MSNLYTEQIVGATLKAILGYVDIRMRELDIETDKTDDPVKLMFILARCDELRKLVGFINTLAVVGERACNDAEKTLKRKENDETASPRTPEQK